MKLEIQELEEKKKLRWKFKKMSGKKEKDRKITREKNCISSFKSSFFRVSDACEESFVFRCFEGSRERGFLFLRGEKTPPNERENNKKRYCPYSFYPLSREWSVPMNSSSAGSADTSLRATMRSSSPPLFSLFSCLFSIAIFIAIFIHSFLLRHHLEAKSNSSLVPSYVLVPFDFVQVSVHRSSLVNVAAIGKGKHQKVTFTSNTP